MSNFFGYTNEAHARSVLGDAAVDEIKKHPAKTKDLPVCTRGLGHLQASWHPPDDQGRPRYCYYCKPIIEDGVAYTPLGPYWVDYGTIIVVITYTIKNAEFSWQL